MPHIAKIVRVTKRDKAAVVTAQLEDGSLVEIWIGGEIEVWFDHRYNKAKGHVKRAQSRDT